MTTQTITQSRKVTHKRKTLAEMIFKKNRTKTKLSTFDYIAWSLVTMLLTNGLIFGTMHYVKTSFKNNEIEKQVDLCRIKQFVINDDYTKSYVCESKHETYFIHENESIDIKQNPYLNRPVKIFNDGTVK